MDISKHFIKSEDSIKKALQLLSDVGYDTVLFVIDNKQRLVGCLTDGDIRRGLLENISIDHSIKSIVNKNPKFLKEGETNVEKLKNLRKKNYKIIPVLDDNKVIVSFVNFRTKISYLPVDVVIMAGGLGSRLKPLTDKTPKPLLKVGDKTIIDHNIDRITSFGVKNIWITVRHMANQIIEKIGNGSEREVRIKYVVEDIPLGTIGAVSKINDFKNDYILVTNSDVLTNINYEDFFSDFIKNEADMSVVTIPYDVKIPYAVMETKDNKVISFLEKPTYTYLSNGGIYLVKKSILKNIPLNKFYNSTDLMELLIEKNLKLISYPMREYWLDIGKHDDYLKAQNDINNIKF